MKNLQGMNFDAVSIENYFAHFLGEKIGQRGGPHDADIFRSGEVASLGNLLEIVADRFEQRVQKITFNTADNQQGGSRHKIERAIGSLRGLASEMKRDKNSERDDYHWLIIGSLILAIHGLLEYAGA